MFQLLKQKIQACKQPKPSQVFVATLEYLVTISKFLDVKLGGGDAKGFPLSPLCRKSWVALTGVCGLRGFPECTHLPPLTLTSSSES